MFNIIFLYFIILFFFHCIMVNLGGIHVSINTLMEGRHQGIFMFKMDGVYFPEVIHFVPGGKRLKEPLSVDLIAFDRSVSFFVFLFAVLFL